MKLLKFVSVFLLAVFAVPFCFAYIDPGTGGYLITSIWGYVVGIVTFVFAFFIRFFRYQVGGWLTAFKKKNENLFIACVLLFFTAFFLLLLFAVLSIFPTPYESGFSLNPYDESLDGVTVYVENKTYEGYTLLEGKLIDMNGSIVQEWPYVYLSYISSDGYYYAQKGYETLEWGKFSLNGTLIWSLDVPIHHEIYEDSNNNIIVLGKEAQEYNGRMVEFDTVLVYSPDGELLDSWSTWDQLAYLQTFHRKLELDKPANVLLPENHEKNESIWGAKHDYYHMNSVTFVPPNAKNGLHPAFNEGNWIISFRHGSMVFILDKDTREVRWTGIADQIPGSIEGQHSPFMDENGNVVIFDNGRYRGWSRIITVDPVSMQILDSYEPGEDFFTYSQGYVQPLANGNWLVTESEDGRVFELTSDREVVWEYYYPYSIDDPEDGLVRDDVYRAYRYEKEFIESYLG